MFLLLFFMFLFLCCVFVSYFVYSVFLYFLCIVSPFVYSCLFIFVQVYRTLPPGGNPIAAKNIISTPQVLTTCRVIQEEYDKLNVCITHLTLSAKRTS